METSNHRPTGRRFPEGNGVYPAGNSRFTFRPAAPGREVTYEKSKNRER
jgi:hypothetical protein